MKAFQTHKCEEQKKQQEKTNLDNTCVPKVMITELAAEKAPAGRQDEDGILECNVCRSMGSLCACGLWR